MSDTDTDIIIRVEIGQEDVQAIAERAGIDPSQAWQRAMDWARHIEESVSSLAVEQLHDAVVYDQP